MRIPVVQREETCAKMIRHAKPGSTTLRHATKAQTPAPALPRRATATTEDEQNRKGERDRRCDQASINKVRSAAHQSVRQSTPNVDGARRMRGGGHVGKDETVLPQFAFCLES